MLLSKRTHIEASNKARKDLLGLSKLIVKYAEEIKVDENKKNYLLSNEKKIYHEYSKNDFFITAKDIENLYYNKKMENNFMSELKFVEEINFPIPHTNFEECYDKDFVNLKMEEIKERCKTKYDIRKFLSFKCSKDPGVGIIVEIVNDMRRKNGKILLDEKLKFVNVNFKGFRGGLIIVFLVFAR